MAREAIPLLNGAMGMALLKRLFVMTDVAQRCCFGDQLDRPRRSGGLMTDLALALCHRRMYALLKQALFPGRVRIMAIQACRLLYGILSVGCPELRFLIVMTAATYVVDGGFQQVRMLRRVRLVAGIAVPRLHRSVNVRSVQCLFLFYMTGQA